MTDTEYEYTGCGVFVSFKTDVQIESYRYHEDKIILDGVFINSSELSLGASATVFISNGVIDFLEIWSRYVDYPTRELTDYALKQQGTFGSGREIKSSRHGAKPNEIN